MSAYNPFRANALSPSSTGASVNTVTSYNPPPSFHSIARDDETTVYFDEVDELPVISEEAGEGSELSRTGTMLSTGTVREDEGTRTPRSRTPLIDLDYSLPPTPALSPTAPEIRIQVEEPPLPPLPLSPRSTGSGTRNGAADDDDVDFPAPQYLDDLPPAYTPAPNFNHGEATLELGPRRPFQQPQQPPRAPHLSAPTPTNFASTPPVQNNTSSSPASPSPGPFASRNMSPFSSLNRGRRGRLGALQQWTEQIFDQLEQVSGVGNLRTGAGADAASTTVSNNRPSQGQAQQQVPRHARSFSDLGSRTGGTTGTTGTIGGGRLSPFPPALPPRLSPNPTGGSATSTINTPNSAPASTTASNSNPNSSIPTSASSDFARDFYAAGTGEGLLDLNPSHSSDDEDDVPLGMRRTGSGASANASGDARSRSFEGLGTSSTPNVPSGSGSNGGTDDDRPTTMPVPGRTLLKDGKILVYPKGFTCPKCFNIGYKRSDPKQPCKKCWKKYAKPYSPVMSYAPDAGSTTTLQRPLPKPTSTTPSTLSVPGGGTTNSLTTRPNTLRRPPQHALHRTSPSVPNLNASAYGSHAMPGSFPPSPSLRTTPTGGSQCTHPFHNSRSPPSPVMSTRAPHQSVPYMQPIQPQQTGGGPAAVVYSAGDPRLGGRRCWQCGGTGRVSYLFFDNSVCMECSGIGRVYH